MLLAVRLKWLRSVGSVVLFGSFVMLMSWTSCLYGAGSWLTPVERSLFQVSKPAFQGQSLKVVGAVG